MDDGLTDTPAAAEQTQAAGANQNCTQLHGNDSCPDDSLPDMIENYMDYSPEACMNMFTVEQAGLMRAMLEGPRASLLGGMVATQDAESIQLEVFPNPVGNVLSLATVNNQVRQLTVIDLEGRQVLKESSNKQQLDLSHLKAGIYFLLVDFQNGEQIGKKVIKN